MLGSDGYPKECRWPDCLVAGDAGPADSEDACAGPCLGQAVARLIQLQSEEVFFADHGLLYLALQRPEEKKWISAKWGVSENKRKSRLYSLTPKGRQQIVEKT